MEKGNKRKILSISITIILTIILVLGLSYAWYTLTLRGSKDNVLKAGNLSLTLSDTASSGISLTSAYPISDLDGLQGTAYQFTLTNNGTVTSAYTIYLDDVALSSGETKLNDKFIKYNLVKDGTSLNTALLTSTGINPNRILDSGFIGANESYTYTLKLWVDINADNTAMNRTFKGKLRIVGEQTEYVRDGLVLMYDGTQPGNVQGKWKDLSGNGNDGTLVNFNNDATSGFTGTSLMFDGVNDVVNLNALTLDNYTVQFVVKPTNGNNYNSLLTDATNNRYTLALGGKFTNALYRFDPNYSGNYGVVEFGPLLNLVKSASFVRRSDTVREVYNNAAKLNLTLAGDSTYLFPKNALKIGYSYWGYLKGDLYSVRIYNRALSQAEINQNLKMDLTRFGVE